MASEPEPNKLCKSPAQPEFRVGSLKINHASVQVVPRGHIPSTQAHIAGLWLTGMNGALRSYVHDCGG